MARNIVPINNEQHANLKLKPGISLGHVENEHILPVTVHEFGHLSGDFPIAFTKHPETGRFQAVGMVGFKQGENYLVQNDAWVGQLPPGIVLTYPFALIQHPNEESQMFVAADMDAELFDVNEGEALFNEDGSESDYFVGRKKNVTDYYEHTQITAMFCELIASLDLFEVRSLSIDIDGQKIGIDGVYIISEDRLHALADDKFLDLKQRGFLPAIYAHMHSFNQVRRLAKQRLEKLSAEA